MARCKYSIRLVIPRKETSFGVHDVAWDGLPGATSQTKATVTYRALMFTSCQFEFID
jgi:hypothetical protein